MPRWSRNVNEFKESIPVPKDWKCPRPKCGKTGYPFWEMLPRQSGNGMKGPYIYVYHGSGAHESKHYIPRSIEKTLHLPPPKVLKADRSSREHKRRER